MAAARRIDAGTATRRVVSSAASAPGALAPARASSSWSTQAPSSPRPPQPLRPRLHVRERRGRRPLCRQQPSLRQPCRQPPFRPRPSAPLLRPPCHPASASTRRQRASALPVCPRAVPRPLRVCRAPRLRSPCERLPLFRAPAPLLLRAARAPRPRLRRSGVIPLPRGAGRPGWRALGLPAPRVAALRRLRACARLLPRAT